MTGEITAEAVPHSRLSLVVDDTVCGRVCHYFRLSTMALALTGHSVVRPEEMEEQLGNNK